MEKSKIRTVVSALQKVDEAIRSLTESLQAACSDMKDCVSEDANDDQRPAGKEKPAIALEEVRGILAGKSRDGHTAEIRAIIEKYGAARLSEINPKDYAAVIREAEAL